MNISDSKQLSQLNTMPTERQCSSVIEIYIMKIVTFTLGQRLISTSSYKRCSRHMTVETNMFSKQLLFYFFSIDGNKNGFQVGVLNNISNLSTSFLASKS